MTLLTLRPRRKAAPELFQRQTSEDSYSSNKSSSKTHRRTSSGRLSISVPKSIGVDISQMSSTATEATSTHSLNMCWSSSDSDTYLPLHVDINNDYSQERKSGGQALGRGSDEREGRSMSAHELEDLIRQLSFSPSQQTKKRTDTADTEASSSSFDSSDYKHTMMSPVGVEFEHEDYSYLRRCPSSPLMGLKYLPD
mmetsp:Transcript_320/g.396  ORF Transcript_320/g.396 Transcript_320/m.396 type:complete len:196 (+) Transcript_320:130-717(+)|eukprot:CAMPEP_0201700204 /NCGR_PEP_ID=MMETSP0578-20130828/27538_1 /ASSEMBLY_ACC=CAM_ASM_000663 /TAXON_ID=267565 /ORGANISM="Skeletonema grethea, Strain CCMP 1804" /LENGTH=195 /DNA_ID=CAMNT_0048187203 /DNA_START=46 /DNA_END=633 /DNA_ORIENTATION=-